MRKAIRNFWTPSLRPVDPHIASSGGEAGNGGRQPGQDKLPVTLAVACMAEQPGVTAHPARASTKSKYPLKKSPLSEREVYPNISRFLSSRMPRPNSSAASTLT